MSGCKLCAGGGALRDTLSASERQRLAAAVCVAARRGYADVCSELLHYGADANSTTPNQVSFVFFCVAVVVHLSVLTPCVFVGVGPLSRRMRQSCRRRTCAVVL